VEHRWTKKIPKTIKVTLYHRNLPIMICNTRDIGKEGVFIDCGPVTLKNKTHLEIEFEAALEYARRRYRLAAMTVHRTEEGLGLFIRDSESEAAKAWYEMVQKADCQLSVNEQRVNPASNLVR
jgi:hypothetical protein